MIKSIHHFDHTFATSSEETIDITSAGVTDINKVSINTTRAGGSGFASLRLHSSTEVKTTGSVGQMISFEIIQHY